MFCMHVFVLLDGMRRYIKLVKHTYSQHNHNRSSLLASTPRNKTTSCDQTLRCRSSTAPNSVYQLTVQLSTSTATAIPATSTQKI
jgi:hypothetical protein